MTSITNFVAGQSDLKSVVFMGYSGAVGAEVLKVLVKKNQLERITLLGRKRVEVNSSASVSTHLIDVFDSRSYSNFLLGHEAAVCTLGVGQPSKVSKEELVKTDKVSVIAFAQACKKSGVKHFQLLGSVAASAQSSSFYLRTKGELVEELKALEFERLTIFQPSMILTPFNRYGLTQGLTLKFWPLLDSVLQGRLRKFRGIAVQTLGTAIAENLFIQKKGFELLHWDEFCSLATTNLQKS